MSNVVPNSSSQTRLCIWQQNLNKSLDSQLDFCHSLKPQIYDIGLIQEPHIDNRGVARANRRFVSIYPPTHTPNHRATRSMILVNTRLPSSSWSSIPIASPDVTAMRIYGDFGTICIINVYNDGAHNDAL
ncbi:hypothetical protein B0H19DRAFT_936548, partial [Mycena capillaripes]